VFGARRITSETTGWKLPFNLAILFHILILSSAIIVPKFLEKKIIVPEFLTVDLVNIAAPLTPPVAEAPSPVTPEKPIEPVISKVKPKIIKAKKTAPIAPVVVEEPETAPAPVKAISIKPIKRKIKKKITPDTSAADARRARKALAREHLAAEKQRQVLERRRQQLLEDARRTKALADAEEAAAKDAVNALKQMYRADAAAKSNAKVVARPGNGRAGGGSKNIIESQYQATIHSIIQEHWNVPDIKPWPPGLIAKVVIKIAKNGRIIGHRFDKKSGDRIFDQFVSRTIQEVNPLPAIPPAMGLNQISFGFNFDPRKIQ